MTEIAIINAGFKPGLPEIDFAGIVRDDKPNRGPRFRCWPLSRCRRQSWSRPVVAAPSARCCAAPVTRSLRTTSSTTARARTACRIFKSDGVRLVRLGARFHRQARNYSHLLESRCAMTPRHGVHTASELRQLTRAQRRKMQKLADRVDRVTQADRLSFERRPDQRRARSYCRG